MRQADEDEDIKRGKLQPTRNTVSTTQPFLKGKKGVKLKEESLFSSVYTAKYGRGHVFPAPGMYLTQAKRLTPGKAVSSPFAGRLCSVPEALIRSQRSSCCKNGAQLSRTSHTDLGT